MLRQSVDVTIAVRDPKQKSNVINHNFVHIFPVYTPAKAVSQSDSQFISLRSWVRSRSCSNHFDICPPLSAVVSGHRHGTITYVYSHGLAQQAGQFFLLARYFLNCTSFPAPGS